MKRYLVKTNLINDNSGKLIINGDKNRDNPLNSCSLKIVIPSAAPSFYSAILGIVFAIPEIFTKEEVLASIKYERKSPFHIKHHQGMSGCCDTWLRYELKIDDWGTGYFKRLCTEKRLLFILICDIL